MREAKEMGRRRRPVRSYPRRRFSRIKSRVLKVLRISGLVGAICLCLVTVWMIGAKAAKPYLIARRESSEIAQIERQFVVAKAEKKKLKEDLRDTPKPEGMTIEARKLGWVKKGEIAVVVEEHRRLKESELSTEQESLWSTFGRWILGFFMKPDAAK